MDLISDLILSLSHCIRLVGLRPTQLRSSNVSLICDNLLLRKKCPLNSKPDQPLKRNSDSRIIR